MSQFCDYTEISLGLKGVQHLNYVFVSKITQNLDFLPQVLDVFLAFAMLHDELHGRDLPCKLSATFVYLHMSKQAQFLLCKSGQMCPVYDLQRA